MKHLYISALALILLACGTDGRDGRDGMDDGIKASRMINATIGYRNSVLDLECNDGTSYWRGTGTKITGGRILTAYHVVKDAVTCSYWSESSARYVGLGGTMHQNKSQDVACIEDISWTDHGKALREVPFLFGYKVHLNELLLLLSFPLDLDSNLQFTFGNVTDDLVSPYDTPRSDWLSAFMSDMVATSGSSGAPVFNRDGNIVAIHVGGYSKNNLDLNYQLPIK
jgi:S1-C subfamily serine protease